jgi:ATP-dependent Clp protease ATP-binding subunit ClpB
VASSFGLTPSTNLLSSTNQKGEPMVWSGNKESKVVRLDESVVPPEIQELELGLLAKVAGQDRAVKQFVRLHEKFLAGMQAPDRPLGVYIFAGPTGSGKTHLAQTAAELLKVKLIKIDCAEFQHSHEIAKLIGSPPGYIGGDVPPILTQEALEEKWKDGPPYTIVLWDEIEKGHNALHQILLGIFDKGYLTTARNVKVDLRKSIHVMTSNLGSATMRAFLDNASMGFVEKKTEATTTDADMYKLVKKEVKKFFSSEFYNRVDRLVVFHPLTDEVLKQILEIELKNLQDRILRANKFISVDVAERGKEFLLKEGTSRELGARELRRTIERHLVSKLVRAFATKAAVDGDMTLADKEPDSRGLVLDIVKGAMKIPEKPAAPSTTVQQPKQIFITPENPASRIPYQGVTNPEFCARCGHRWDTTHRCDDLNDDPFQRFKRAHERKRNSNG